MWRQRSDRQHGPAGGFLGKSDTIVARHHYHRSRSNLPKVIVVVSNRGDQRVLQHGRKPKRQKIGSSIQRLSHTRLHPAEVEQSFIDIKKEQFGSLHKLRVKYVYYGLNTSVAAANSNAPGTIAAATPNIISPARLRKIKLALGGNGRKNGCSVQYSACVKKNDEPEGSALSHTKSRECFDHEDAHYVESQIRWSGNGRTRITIGSIMSKAAFVILASGDSPESLGRVVNALIGAYEMMGG